MGPFKKYITCIITYFNPFILVTVCQFYSVPSLVLFNKNEKNYGIKEKKLFCIYGCFIVSRSRRQESIFRQNLISRQTCINKQGILTQKRNYNILCKDYIAISDTLIGSWMFFFLISHCNSIRATWKTQKERLSDRKWYIETFA